MLQFLVRRLAIFVPMLFLMSVVSFAIIQAPPGDYLTDYVAQLQAQGESINPGELEALRERYGLGEPVHVQYQVDLGRGPVGPGHISRVQQARH